MKLKPLLFALSLALAFISHAKDLHFKHLNVSDGLSQLSIFSIYQDEIGAVWLGTNEGLNRYNGEQVSVFRPSQGNDGLTNNEIHELCGNRKGLMFIRSGNDLVKMDLYKEQFTCLHQGGVLGISYLSDTLWVQTINAVYYYTEQEQQLTHFADLQGGLGDGITLLADTETLWVVTTKHLLAINRNQPLEQKVMASFSIPRCITKDQSGNIWVGTWNGLYRVSKDGNIRLFTTASGSNGLSDNQVRCILEDDANRIWVGTFRGLDCYDPATNTWDHYTRYGDGSNSLSHNSIWSLHKDMQGDIWVGTYYGGVNVFSPDRISNHYYHAEPLQPDGLSFPFVSQMTEDNEGYVWICTEGGGLNRFDPRTGKFTRYLHKPGDDRSIGNNNIKSILFWEESNSLYIGTHLGGLSVLDLNTHQIRVIRRTEASASSPPYHMVNILQPYNGIIALLTQAGPFFFNPKTERFSPVTDDPEVQQFLNKEYSHEAFYIDSRQRMWLGLTKGGLVCVDLPTSKVEQYLHDVDNPSCIGKFKVDHIFEDKQGNLYFSTIGSGLFKFLEETRSFKSYNTANGLLPSDYCYYMCESPNHPYFYILHNSGFSIFDPEERVVERTFTLFDQRYNQGSTIYMDKAGETIYVGGVNGLAHFNEQYLFTTPVSTHLSFDKLFLYNKEIQPADGTGILTDIMAKTSEIRLNYNQNHIAIQFATFNYLYDQDMMFEYRLENLDKTWIQTNSHTLSFTNLPPGDYTLNLRQLDDNMTPMKEISLGIHVAAPYYATTWAYMFYTLVVLSIVIFFFRFKIRQAALRSSLAFERKEKERIEELNQTKLRFFTNISHEFRTPLTLILGQIEILMQMDKLGVPIYNRILRIYKNAFHMRTLISELLDFRKQEQGYLKLKVEEHDLVGFTRQIYICFYEYAQKKHINYAFNSSEDTILVWFDAVQLHKVVFNLLSNAFKYTSDNGSITVEVKMSGSCAMVSVNDNGAGISKEDAEKVFERFYQTDNVASQFSLGTGIGLALSKGIIDAHHGQIEVQSIVGKGSSFMFSLLLGKEHFSKDEISVVDDRDATVLPDNLPVEVSVVELDTKYPELQTDDNGISENETAKPVILLVEDNEELLSMLSEMFDPLYEVHTARNGREGLELAGQLQPDLIVSDVMMPEMSGKEMCYKIKNSVELSHISVILLTAQTSTEYIMEGYMFGADDYVTKPFNMKILIARCNNLLNNKKRLKSYYAGKTLTEETVSNAVNERDKELLEKCIRIIRENFENPDFDVTLLASELCMGRSKLYLRFKDITGLTPNEYILKVKLDEAMSLLKNNPEYNISEISDQLGFSTPRYFRKCFKSFFGVAPQGVRGGNVG